MFFKRVLKLAFYGFMGIWMFVLGVMVGRGTAPIAFDTREFQERLHDIVRKSARFDILPERIELAYNEALTGTDVTDDLVPASEPEGGYGSRREYPEHRVPRMSDIPEVTLDAMDAVAAGHPVAPESAPEDSGEIPVKSGMKSATMVRASAPVPPAPEPAPSGAAPRDSESGRYTIQVAAYKSSEDADRHKALLDEKKISSRRTRKEIGGVTWYRIRVGGFPTHAAAARELEALNRAGVSGMIIKEE